ncbi:MAG TPA: CHAT domain-containing protein, partial [Thermotogota bacterium]|nr:CHAT domain-containing protein [Thermotogota bacterium]
ILDKNGQEPLEQTVHSLNNLGILKRFTGEYVEAERLYLKALQLQKAYSGTDTMPYTNLLNNLGLLYFSLGIDATAKQYYEEAIDIRRRLVGEKSVPFMQSLNNLAAYHQRAGEWGIAEMEYLRVLSFLETRGMFNHPAYNKTLKNYAALLLRMSRHSEAITYLDRALSGLSQKVGVDNVAYAKFVAEKGYALYQMKRYPESEKAAMSAFRTMAVTSGIRNFETLSVLSQLSAVLVKTGKPEAAYRTALNVVRWQNELLFDMVYALPEEEMMAFLRSIRTDSDRLMSLLVNCFPKDRRKIENVYAVVLLRKGIILEVSALRAFFLDKRESAEKPWMREWKEAKTALSKLLYYNNPAVTLAEKMEMVKKIQSRIQEIERKEARQFASAMPLENSKRINIPSLYEKIGDHSTVLDFYYLESENRYILFVLEDRSISTRSIDDAKTLHEKIREFRHAIGYCQQTRGTPDIHMVKRTIRFQEECARNLYRRLFSSAELKRNRDYHLSPDYEMATLPFDALQTPEGEYLLEFCDIHCLTTPKELFREAFNRANKLTASIVVDPDFGEMPVSGVKRPEDPDQRVPEIYDIFRNAGLAERGFTRLKGTKYEGQKARELLEQAGWTIDAYLSGNAAKKHTIAGHRFPKLLHIATHGFFLDQSQEGVNPLLRSGLVFAGANAGGDSILTAYEVTALDLSQTETVILSACNTGLGESFIGEG